MSSFKQAHCYQQRANASNGKGSRRLPTESVDNPVCYFVICCAKPRGIRRSKNNRKIIAKLKHNKINELFFCADQEKEGGE
ncbi:hypothetical protein HNR75_001791 [Tolumonas osonensis]|uniref:Uncharacterized protein n=1 Tax=Tolumonas osonensis TaxID=675874 RepID=A0A841GQJ9_9GAMM|nr:hypothetical protein [Tolumonas osonensis]